MKLKLAWDLLNADGKEICERSQLVMDFDTSVDSQLTPDTIPNWRAAICEAASLNVYKFTSVKLMEYLGSPDVEAMDQNVNLKFWVQNQRNDKSEPKVFVVESTSFTVEFSGELIKTLRDLPAADAAFKQIHETKLRKEEVDSAEYVKAFQACRLIKQPFEEIWTPCSKAIRNAITEPVNVYLADIAAI